MSYIETLGRQVVVENLSKIRYKVLKICNIVIIFDSVTKNGFCNNTMDLAIQVVPQANFCDWFVILDVTIQCGSFRAAKRILQYAMMHHHFYLLITTPSEFHVRGADNNRGRRLQQKDVAVSSTRADLKFDTLREIMSSNDSFFSQRSYTFMMEEALASKIPRSLSQHDGKTRGRLKKLNRSDIVNTDKHPNISKKSITVAEKNSANIAEGTGCNDRLELKEARGNRSDQTAGRKSEVCLLDDCLNQLGLVDIRNDKSRTVQVTAGTF